MYPVFMHFGGEELQPSMMSVITPCFVLLSRNIPTAVAHEITNGGAATTFFVEEAVWV